MELQAVVIRVEDELAQNDGRVTFVNIAVLIVVRDDEAYVTRLSG